MSTSLPDVRISGGDGPGSLPRGAEPLAPEAPASEGVISPRLRERLWWAARVAYRARWVLIAITILAAGLSVWLALLMPNRFQAETRVMLPDSGDGFGGLLESIAPGASAILGQDGGGGYTRYSAILTSRTSLEEVVDRFDLVRVYETQEKASPRDEAVAALSANTGIGVDLEYDYLSVRVLDESPERAADIANYYVAVLNRRHIALSSGSAAEQREFLETRLNEAELALDSARQAMQAFQERNGVVQLESQAEALMGAIGAARGQVAEAEVRYQALRSQYGDENPDVSAARAAVSSAQSQLNRLTGGEDAVMPIPLQQFPAVGRQYGQLMQELKTQEAILTAIRPMYEQAAMSERRDASAVQVLDPAVPPSRKAEPRRSIIILSATLAAPILALLLLLTWALVRENGARVFSRLRAES